MADILDTLADLEDEEFESDLLPTLEVKQESKELYFDDNGDLSEERAREITEAIRSAATVTFILLAQAHEHNAHKALGYETWAEYVQGEFDMSAQRSYQLLDLSKVVNEIETVTPEGTTVKITEAQARDIKRELPRVTENIRDAIDEGEDPDAAVQRVINDIRDQKKADDKAIAEKTKALEDAQREGYESGLENAADSLLEADRPDGLTNRADGDFIEVEVAGDGAGELSPEDSMNLYNFFNVLSGLSSLPEPDDFVQVVPKARAEEIENQLLEAVSWLNRFQTLWELREE